MVTLGKLNMTEFAYSGHRHEPALRHAGQSQQHRGAPRPRRLVVRQRRGGGGEGSCPAPSARIPAARCASRRPINGVVGYKTSLGRIDTTGLVALARSYDTVGPLARSVEDCILLDRALRGAIGAELLRADLAA